MAKLGHFMIAKLVLVNKVSLSYLLELEVEAEKLLFKLENPKSLGHPVVSQKHSFESFFPHKFPEYEFLRH